MTKLGYLRKRDIVNELNMPRSTISDWLDDFHMFMPTMQRGSTKLYDSDVLEVLTTIKTLREDGYYKEDIFKKLQENGFAIVVENEDDKKELESNVVFQNQVSDNTAQELYKIYGLINQMMQGILERDRTITDLNDIVKTLSQQGSVTDGRITDMEKTLQEVAVSTEVDSLKKENIEIKRIYEQLEKRLDEQANQVHIKSRLEEEALDNWNEKPSSERIIKTGFLGLVKVENTQAKDTFVKKYVSEHIDVRYKVGDFC